jgi:hypothetical protein
MGPPSHIRTAIGSLGVALLLLAGAGVSAAADGPGPTPVPDPFDVPVLPDNPTQVDLGRDAYFYHCMPCHGDQGQGLTDEFRQMWEEDHQDCWSRGCHNQNDAQVAFPIPRSIPPVSGGSTTLARFAAPQELHDYLVATHPPQRPGALEAAQYWAVTAFLLAENGRLAPEATVGPVADSQGPVTGLLLGAIGLAAAAVILTLALVRRRAGRAGEMYPKAPGGPDEGA